MPNLAANMSGTRALSATAEGSLVFIIYSGSEIHLPVSVPGKGLYGSFKYVQCRMDSSVHVSDSFLSVLIIGPRVCMLLRLCVRVGGHYTVLVPCNVELLV